MADERVNQQGTNQSAPGAFGLYSLNDDDMGNPAGDVVDSTFSKNNVKSISFNKTRDLQGTGTTFYYPYGRSQQQEF